MLPLNPFLAAFFRTNLPSQCVPVHHHVLLVPATNVLLTWREVESGATAAEFVTNEEFLASHILRIPNTNVIGTGPNAIGADGKEISSLRGSSDGRGAIYSSSSGGKDGGDVGGVPPAPTPNLREVRGKGKVYATINGRSVIIKDAAVLSNKGFKTLVQATLLTDATWYADTVEPRQWLVYYISRPLVGDWQEVKIEPALLEGITQARLASQRAAAGESSEAGSAPKKKDIGNFHDVLNHFPLIAKHMQPGLERLFREFITVLEPPLPPPPSARNIPDPIRHGPIVTALRRARSNSSTLSSARIVDSDRMSSSLPNSVPGAQPGPLLPSVIEDSYSENDEDVMRALLESAVTTAIDLFQTVDKQQLSLLGATTDLTGPVVERLIERYVAENINHVLYPRIVTLKRSYDLDLESRIKRMEFIDVSQLGIAIRGGCRAKHELTLQLGQAVDELRKINTAMSPQEMMHLLLSTLREVARLIEGAGTQGGGGSSSSDQSRSQTEKPMLTLNADTLVSLLLFVVIRSQVRQLQARLTYVRNFIFVDDVDNGEMGYALSTFEAVLAYLAFDSAGLRKASRRNKALWDAATRGDLNALRSIMEPSDSSETNSNSGGEDEDEDEDDDGGGTSSHRSGRRRLSVNWGSLNESSRRSSVVLTVSERFSLGSGLSHVFPFQSGWTATAATAATTTATATAASAVVAASEEAVAMGPPQRRVKKVAMDTRSMSSESEISFHSRATSTGTLGSTIGADLSVNRLAWTCNRFGESVLMMAVQNEQVEALQYLLSLAEYYPIEAMLDDVNEEETTLLSAAVQLGSGAIIDVVLDTATSRASPEQLGRYAAAQDIWGRSFGHYLFHTPALINRVGGLVRWRQRDKNGQTPLFALCRSYDHTDYHNMVATGLAAATAAQADGQPLHVDDHVDAKGNTLLHVVHDVRLVMYLLRRCDVDVNAINEKRLTALMVASKYGRYDMVRSLYADSRVDISAREVRGLTAVELAKDDDVRSKMDDLALFAMAAATPGGRITGVVRAFFVEDATVRLVVKSAAPSDPSGRSYTVTTSRRSLSDFEYLSNLLALENPASWMPAVAGLRTPFQIPSRPSRAVLRDIQARADRFVKVMLAHPTFATHEMLWEFLLVPELQLATMEQRSRLKAEARAERVRDELEPVADPTEVERFVDHARDNVRAVKHATKSAARRLNAIIVAATDLSDAVALLHRALGTFFFLPVPHMIAFDSYLRTLLHPSPSGPHDMLHTSLIATQSTMQAVLAALSRPAALAIHAVAARRAADRARSALAHRRSPLSPTPASPDGSIPTSRWPLPLPLGILDDTRQRLASEREERTRRIVAEADRLGRELRYSQQVVAGELAGWHDLHGTMGRQALREFAAGMLVLERGRLQGMTRALRRLREGVFETGN